jgi:L-threonylcarbamoyladenylate synthase
MATFANTSTPALFEAAVQKAADLLRAGEVVAIPTETVYGLAANALDAQAVARIFAVKGRPAHNPIIVHVASTELARHCTAVWPDAARKLAAAFWPGPLTLVLPKAAVIPDMVTAGGGTVGIRWPNHPVTQAIIRRCGLPLAAPSANRSGQVSPTTAEHVARGLGNRIPLIVDAGPAAIGIESTVLDLSVRPPRVLRPGMIGTDSLAAIVGTVLTGNSAGHNTLRSPGLLLKHYAPTAKVLISSRNAEALVHEVASIGIPLSRVHLLTRDQALAGLSFGRVCTMPRDPGAFARALYAELHRCDQLGAQLIVIQAVPDELAWSAVADRLRHAAA